MSFTNEFSWSKSRSETLESCQLKYWFNHYGFWNGWSNWADEFTQKAYLLKKLYNRHAWAGVVVHSTIEDVLHGIKDDQSYTPEEIIEKGVQALRTQYLESKNKAYLKNAKRYLGLREHYYNEPVSDDDWVAIRATVKDSLQKFAKKFLPKVLIAEILSFEELESFQLEGNKIWVSLDLAVKTHNGIEIWDWKTGRNLDVDVTKDLQLGTYLHFASKKWETENITAKLIPLNSEQEVLSVHFADFNWEHYFAEVSSSIEMMKSLLDNPNENVAKMENFKPDGATKTPKQCPNCNYRELCPAVEPASKA